MAAGSGLSASLGFATETTVGTPTAVTRFIEFDKESIGAKKHTSIGEGLRQGSLLRRARRRVFTGIEFGGDVEFAVPTAGFGLMLQHMLGSFGTSPTSLGGGLYQQIHNIGTLNGKAFTTQIVRPDTTGVLTQEAYTYAGCKVTDWELSCKAGDYLQAKIGIDALVGATPSDSFAPTTLSAAPSAGATSISTVASVPAGSILVIDTGLTQEVVQTTTVTGSGPYTVNLATALTQAHLTGARVQSATGINYGAAVALQTASYGANVSTFSFVNGSLVAGGSTSSVSGVWTNSGGQTVANVHSISLKGQNGLKQDRWSLGSTTRSEQIENDFRDYTAEAEVEYNGRAWYDGYLADTPMALKLRFTEPGGGSLVLYTPVGFQDDGDTAQVDGPDVLEQKLKFAILDDGANGALQAVYTSTDSTV